MLFIHFHPEVSLLLACHFIPSHQLNAVVGQIEYNTLCGTAAVGSREAKVAQRQGQACNMETPLNSTSEITVGEQMSSSLESFSDPR